MISLLQSITAQTTGTVNFKLEGTDKTTVSGLNLDYTTPTTFNFYLRCTEHKESYTTYPTEIKTLADFGDETTTDFPVSLCSYDYVSTKVKINIGDKVVGECNVRDGSVDLGYEGLVLSQCVAIAEGAPTTLQWRVLEDAKTQFVDNAITSIKVVTLCKDKITVPVTHDFYFNAELTAFTAEAPASFISPVCPDNTGVAHFSDFPDTTDDNRAYRSGQLVSNNVTAYAGEEAKLNCITNAYGRPDDRFSILSCEDYVFE